MLTEVTTIPSFEDLSSNPQRALVLPVDVVASLLGRCEIVHEALKNALAVKMSPVAATEPIADDRLLTVEEASAMSGLPIKYLYRHSRDLPFAKHISRKMLRFSAVGLKKWMAQKRP